MSSGAISVSMSMTGMPASIILLTGAVSVPMPNAWMATKSHFCEAMLSIAARCLTASSWPSNQVTSTLNSLPQYSAACLPWAHQVACNPALENAALSGFSDRPAASANAVAIIGLTPNPPNRAAAPAPAAAALSSLRRSPEISFVSVITSSLRPGVPRQSSRSGRPCHGTLLGFNTCRRGGNIRARFACGKRPAIQHLDRQPPLATAIQKLLEIFA